MKTDATTITKMGIISDEAYLKKYFIGDANELKVNDTTYEVIDHTDTSTDMQALLLEKIDSSGKGLGEFVVAFRGTAGAVDVLVDGVVGLGNINAQYSDALSFVNTALQRDDIDKNNLTLTGHSLGGILTQQVGATLGLEGYAYNPYGVDRLLTNLPNTPGLLPAVINIAIYKIMDAVGLDSPEENWAKEHILNVSYNDFGVINGDILSNFATGFSSAHIGSYMPIFGADEDFGDGHRMKVLNSAIAHYNTVLNHFTQDTTYEDLSKAYLLTGGFERVEDVFNDLNIDDTTDNSLSFNFLDDKLPTQLQSTDKANLYALKHLLPFTIEGNLPAYDTINPDDYSEMYIADRAYYLYYTMDRENRYDKTPALNYYEDTALGDAYTLDKGDWNNKVIFGSDSKDDVLEGDANSDHLYGNGGDDTLKGGNGNDYLEGGEGFDTYVIEGEGENTVVEDFLENGTTVSGGKIIFNDKVLDKATDSEGDGIYTDEYNNTYTFDGTDLTISSSDKKTKAIVKDYDKEFNIKASFYSLSLFLEKSNQKSVRRDSFLNPFYNFKKSDSAELELKFSNSPRITSTFFHLQKGKLKSHLDERNLLKSVA